MPWISWPGRLDFGRGRGTAICQTRAQSPDLRGVRVKRRSGEVTKPRKGESPKQEIPDKSAEKRPALIRDALA